MEFNIKMKKEPYEMIQTIMHNIKELNNGYEIGAWLTGEWEIKEEESTLIIDGIIIPEQTVSSIEVDISPESMIKTIKEIGINNTNKIKAHWHIHPFGKGETDWSATDEEKIKDFMDPTKERELFTFLLSSEDKMKARVVMNIKQTNETLKIQETITESIDDLEVEEITRKRNTKIEQLKEIIKEKIKVEKETTKFDRYTGWHYNWKDYKKEEKKFKIRNKKGKTKIILTEEFAEFVETTPRAEDIMELVTKVEKIWDKNVYTLELDKKKNKNKTIKNIKTLLESLEDEHKATEEINEQIEEEIDSRYLREYIY